MKILVTGSSGLVGSRFLELSRFRDSFLAPDFSQFDLTNRQQVSDFLLAEKPDMVVNFAAFTDVGAGEKERNNKNGLCWKLNYGGVQNLLLSIEKSPETRLVHISTDMVFPGSKLSPGPYDENQLPETKSNDVTWYGFSKGEAERLIRKNLGNQTTILRLIYPVRAKYPLKLDYLRKPLKLYDERKLYPMFTDQQVSISFIDEICRVLDKMIDQKAVGTFHASSRDTSSPFKLVSYLLGKARGNNHAVKPAKLEDFLKTVDNPVRYPRFGGLKVTSTEKKLGIKFSSWREIITKLVEQGIGV